MANPENENLSSAEAIEQQIKVEQSEQAKSAEPTEKDFNQTLVKEAKIPYNSATRAHSSVG